MIRADWMLVTGPTQEPLSVDEAKQHLIVHQDDDNALIESYLRATRTSAETHLGRGLLTQTWKLLLSAFADVIWLPMAAPLQNDPNASPSTAPVVKYYDDNGTLQTLATTEYLVNTVSEPGQITRGPNKSWPSVQADRLWPVEIVYVCGWEDPADVPESIKQGMRVYLMGMEADRGDGSIARKAAEAIWSPDVVRWIPPQACLADPAYVG